MEGDSDGNEDGLLNHDPQGSKGFDSLTLRNHRLRALEGSYSGQLHES